MLKNNKANVSEWPKEVHLSCTGLISAWVRIPSFAFGFYTSLIFLNLYKNDYF